MIGYCYIGFRLNVSMSEEKKKSHSGSARLVTAADREGDGSPAGNGLGVSEKRLFQAVVRAHGARSAARWQSLRWQQPTYLEACR